MPEAAEMSPVRFTFEPLGNCHERVEPNTAYSSSLGVPVVKRAAPHNRKLAIVGSGPSLKEHLQELRDWDGDIWGINGTVNYLTANGIESTLISVDPGYVNDTMNAKDALLSAACEPKLFDQFAGRVQRFFINPHPEAQFVVIGGCTTATRAPLLGLLIGYVDITFYGCEGSYEGNSHVYADKKSACEMYIWAGGRDYRTDPEALMQCENLSAFLTKFPHIYKEKCGGLLRAVMENPDTWTTTHVSGELKNRLEANIQLAA